MVHRQYLCNTYSLHIISLLNETSVPLVHETMDAVSEESLGLRAEPFFNGFSDLIFVCEPASHKCFVLVARTHGNRKVLPLGITAPQPQSHFHLGTPYIYIYMYIYTGPPYIQGPPKKCIHILTKENSTLCNRLL